MHTEKLGLYAISNVSNRAPNYVTDKDKHQQLPHLLLSLSLFHVHYFVNVKLIWIHFVMVPNNIFGQMRHNQTWTFRQN